MKEKGQGCLRCRDFDRERESLNNFLVVFVSIAFSVVFVLHFPGNTS
jgi:hypothetical protein